MLVECRDELTEVDTAQFDFKMRTSATKQHFWMGGMIHDFQVKIDFVKVPAHLTPTNNKISEIIIFNK